MNNGEEQEKRQIQENKKNPTGNLRDSINRSMAGDLGALAKGGSNKDYYSSYYYRCIAYSFTMFFLSQRGSFVGGEPILGGWIFV